MKKSSLSLKKQFNEAIAYIKISAKYIYVSVLIFLIAAFFGFIFRDNLTFLNKILEELIRKTEGLNTIEMIFFILQNNLLGSILAIALGVFLGIFPSFSSLTNGVILGYVLGLTYDATGFTEFWRLLPHGIFELPAIFISFGLGIKLGFSIFTEDINKEFKKNFYNSMNAVLMIIIPLLIIAAVIEGILIGIFY